MGYENAAPRLSFPPKLDLDEPINPVVINTIDHPFHGKRFCGSFTPISSLFE
jgi:hypothetical protein